jgi:SM-20-related protein
VPVRWGNPMLEQKTNEQVTSTPILDLDKVRFAKLKTEPFDYLVASDFIRPEWHHRLIQEFPYLKQGGSFPLSAVKVSAGFLALIEAMDSEDFRKLIEQKFSVDLEGRPTTFTVRGHCRAKDGKIHTDTESKIITVLLYMNREWPHVGGRLRLLRSATDLDNVVKEISPSVGTLVIFRRCDHSFHGHLPFEGDRKVIQMNWVTDERVADREVRRHRWSSMVKQLTSLRGGSDELSG